MLVDDFIFSDMYDAILGSSNALYTSENGLTLELLVNFSDESTNINVGDGSITTNQLYITTLISSYPKLHELSIGDKYIIDGKIYLTRSYEKFSRGINGNAIEYRIYLSDGNIL